MKKKQPKQSSLESLRDQLPQWHPGHTEDEYRLMEVNYMQLIKDIREVATESVLKEFYKAKTE